ncbi:cytochrome P450 [Roseofilum casamattae]|uniref:Cytochrome P450 n=1 Tax=Roseofilum casamattae BLCC-M143 TaxID=3022442 RepID=A0ABT7C0D0_9CYAN|nr:cytochrome P450 [Roseofilum casamattae]MDJ1184900.1 cytochrome P450 [Roseofilum casamattae BLCC-M143]
MKLPDGPKTPPLFQLLQWIADPLGYMETSRQRYGDVFSVHLSSLLQGVFISNPQLIQAIFTADSKLFDSGAGNQSGKIFVGDNSLLLLDGDRHQRQRRLITPPFHGERMRAYGDLICLLTKQLSEQWIAGQPFSVRESMQEISLRVILQAVFGLNEGPRYRELRQSIAGMMELTASPLRSSMLFFTFLQKDLGAWSPWGRFLRRQQHIDRLLYAEIEERRGQDVSDRTDILSLMLSARDERGEGMSDVELRDELITLLLAGHETTVTALCWALYWIHYQPQVREKLLQELDGLGENADPTEIARLPYLTAVCQETLRIYPPLFLTWPRILKAPLQLGDYQFDANTKLLPCIYLTHQREDLYPEPKQFKPERFLERQYSAGEFLAFGGGNRRCVGAALAMFEMKLVVATLLSNYELALVDRRPLKPQRRGFFLAPPSGFKMVAIDRPVGREQSRESVAV